MCRSMVDIQSPTAEIRRGKKEEERRQKEERNYRMKILWSAQLHRATINILLSPCWVVFLRCFECGCVIHVLLINHSHQPCDCSITQYRNMDIWISWNIDIRRSLNSRDSFSTRKFYNRAPITCRSGAILWLPAISFELRAKVAEEIDLEMCSCWQLSEDQMLRDLDLHLGSDQGYINVHSTCSTTSRPYA